MDYKKYKGNYQNVSQQAQREGFLILTIDELMKRAVKLKGLNNEIISGSAVILNPFAKEVKVSRNFTNEYFLKPENFYKCSAQIKAGEYDSINGEVLSLNNFNSNLGIMRLDDAVDNEILNKLTDRETLKKFINLYRQSNIHEVKVDLGFSKTSLGIFPTIPIGINSEGYCKGMSREPCSGKVYLAKK